MSKGHNLQDPFLNVLRKERIPVSIFLVNGIKLQGQIESFDQFVVLLKILLARWSISTQYRQLFHRALCACPLVMPAMADHRIRDLTMMLAITAMTTSKQCRCFLSDLILASALFLFI